MTSETSNISHELLRRLEHYASQGATPSPSLKSGGGGGTFDGMDTVDAKIAAAEARTDTKFGELMSELKLINVRMEHVEKSTSGLRLNTWMAAASAVALVAAIFGWGSSMFGVGMNVESVANKAADTVMTSAQPQINTLNARYVEMNNKLDEIFQLLSKPATPSPSPEDAPNASPMPMPTVPQQ